MIVAATIGYNTLSKYGIPVSHTEERVFTNKEFASLDDILNYLRFEYLQKYDEVSVKLLIDLDNVEYSLDLHSKVLRRIVVKELSFPETEQYYLYFLFNLAHLGEEFLSNWIAMQEYNYSHEDELIKDFTRFRDV